MKKILIFTDKISYSGASKIVCWLANNISIEDTKTSLITHSVQNDYRQVNENVKRINIEINESNKFLSKIKLIIKLHKLIANEKYNLCIGFLPVECFYLKIATLFCKTKLVVCERSDPYLENSIIAKIGRFIYRLADGAVFQTEGAKSYFPKKLQKKSIIIPNPAFKSNLPIIPYKDRAYEISTSGRLYIKQKRQDILLKAFKNVCEQDDKISLKIYGDGQDMNILKTLAENLKIQDRVFFMGKSSNVEEEIANSKLFVLTSDYEGIPNVIIEAMQMGVPIISTDCSPGGAKILVKDDINGYIVPREDIKNLANRIIFLLNRSDIAERIAINNQSVIERFSEIKIIKIWEDYIKKFII